MKDTALWRGTPRDNVHRPPVPLNIYENPLIAIYIHMYVQEGGGWRELDVATRRGQTKLKQERDVHMINCIN